MRLGLQIYVVENCHRLLQIPHLSKLFLIFPSVNYLVFCRETVP